MSARADQLGEGGKDAELKRVSMEQQGKRREVLLSAPLGNGLVGSITEAVPAAWFAEVLCNRL